MTHVSIIIPVYNAETWLSTSISSALCQRPQVNCEVIVVNDGSNDASQSIIDKFGDDVISKSQVNRGASAARNLGLKLARGKYIKFLDADDFLLPGSLSMQLDHAESLTPNEISFGRILRQEDDGRILPHDPSDAEVAHKTSMSMKDLILRPPVLPSILYPKADLERQGGFNEGFGLLDDFDLFLRMILAGKTFSSSRSPTYVYRNHQSSRRLSLRIEHEDISSVCSMFRGHLDLLESSRSMHSSNEIRIGLGAVIWIMGRRALQAGHEDLAMELFALSKRSAAWDGVKGNRSYKLLVRLLGPLLAEVFSTTVKTVVRRLAPK